MLELKKELNRLRENCKKIDSYFDDDNEALDYCKNKISSLNEEIEVFDNMVSKFGDIISNYDDYKNCFIDYINGRYMSFGKFVIFQLLIVIVSFVLLFNIADIRVKLVFLFVIFVCLGYDFYIYSMVNRIRLGIVNDIYDKYGVDISKLTEEDIDDMEMSLLQDKVRSVHLRKEIDEYEFYFDWKRGMIEGNEFGISNNIKIEES